MIQAERVDPLPGDRTDVPPGAELDEALETAVRYFLSTDSVEEVEVQLFNRRGDLVRVAEGLQSDPMRDREPIVWAESWLLDAPVQRHSRRQIYLPEIHTKISLSLIDEDEPLGVLRIQLDQTAVLDPPRIRNYRKVVRQLSSRVHGIQMADTLQRLESEQDFLREENKDLARRVSALSKELYAVTAISTKINQSMDFEKSLRRSLRKLRDVFKANRVTIFVDDEELGSTPLSESDGDHDLSPRPADADHRLVKDLKELHRPAVVRRDLGKGGQGESLVAVPLQTREECVGYLVLATVAPGRIGPDAQRLLSGIANIMAMAIENMALYRKSERGKRDASFLAHAISQFNGMLDLRQVLESVVGKGAEFAGAGGRAYLITATKFPLLRALQPGGQEPSMKIAESVRAREVAPVLRFLVTCDGPVLVGAGGGWEEDRVGSMRPCLDDLDIGSLIGLPLVSRAGNLGMLILGRADDQTSFAARDLSIAEALANAAAGAIENAREYAFSLDMNDSNRFRITEKEDQIHRIHKEQRRRIEERYDLVFWIDNEDRFVFGNSAMENLTGYSKDSLSLGTVGMADAIPEEDWVRLKRSFDEIRAGFLPKTENLEYRQLDRRGGEHVVSLSVSPLKDLAGQMIGLEGIGRDITEQKRLEDELEKAKDLALLGEFSCAVAHQIRNPLGNILLGSKLLQKALELDGTGAAKEGADGVAGGRRKPDRRALDRIFTDLSDGIANLNHIVTELLDYTKTMQLHRSPQDVNLMLMESLELFETALRQTGIDCRFLFEERLPPVYLDAVLISNVFRNIIHNAIYAMPRDGELTLLSGRCAWDEDKVMLSVVDDGPGIPPENLERIFRPFYTTKNEGVGLGLSLAHRVVDAHGGMIWACNNPCKHWPRDLAAGEKRKSAPPTRGASIHVLLPCQGFGAEKVLAGGGGK